LRRSNLSLLASLPGGAVSATATNVDTSEFSENEVVVQP